ACASVRTTSQLDPSAAPPLLRQVLVVAPHEDLQLQQEVERQVVAAGSGEGVALKAYHQVFLPGRQYDPDVVLRTLQEQGVEGLLILRDATTAGPTTRATFMAIPPCSAGASSVCMPGDIGLMTASAVSRQDEYVI